ncbi:MAG: queuosine precursor transporter [Planctomycetota bacterium]|jgi:uncharacterized PurR-regulated membrane protein YhhQ (DUF165 family)|nr:queuosine precursor transporter [Planctomycetota bacterium]
MPASIDSALRRSRFERDYVFVTSVFTVLMVLTNVIGTKLFCLLPDYLPRGFGALTDQHFVTLTTGLVTYPLTFLLTDVCSEVYGRRRANYMVVLGFLCSLLMLATLQVAGWMPRADRWWADAAGQPVYGTQVLTDSAAGATGLPIDDGEHLLLADGEAGTAVALAADGPVILTYTGITAAQHLLPGAEADSPIRADHRGELQLTEPLANALSAGTWVVPGVRVTAATDAAVVVDRPWVMPAVGVLQATDGSLLSYSDPRDGASGRVALAPAWNSPRQPDASTLAPGAVLGVVTQRSPHQMGHAFRAVFSAPASLLFASMLAYLLAQFLDVWLYHLFKRATGGRHLWLRNNGSTMVSQLADTIVVHVIFLPLAFAMPWAAVFQVILGVYVVKMVLAWIDTPLIYAGTWLAKRRLGYGFRDEVDDDLLGTSEGYPQGVVSGLKRLLSKSHGGS